MSTTMTTTMDRERDEDVLPTAERPRQNRLRELRRARGLTQAQVASALGKSEQSVARWEKGGHGIPWKYEQPLANLFDLASPDELYREPDPIRRVPVVRVAASGEWTPPRPEDEALEWAVMERVPDLDGVALRAVRLADRSLDRRSIGPGSTLFYVPLEEERVRAVRDGALYVVLRQRGGREECVVRVATEAPDGARWFVPDSTTPTYDALPQTGTVAEPIVVLGRVVFMHARP